MEKILADILSCLDESKEYIPELDEFKWQIQEEIASKLIAKKVILELIQELHNINTLREKEKFEIELITALEKL